MNEWGRTGGTEEKWYWGDIKKISPLFTRLFYAGKLVFISVGPSGGDAARHSAARALVQPLHSDKLLIPAARSSGAIPNSGVFPTS